MSLRQGTRAVLMGPAFAAAMAFVAMGGVAHAQSALVPPGFFSNLPKASSDAAVIEADVLSYDGDTATVSAEGDVVVHNNGITLKGDRLVYHQKTGGMKMIGNVDIVDAQGTHYVANTLDVTDGMKEAVLESMTLTTPGGTRITADDVHYATELQTILNNATYSPCGDCIDAKGNRIGWQVKAARFTYDAKTKMVYLEQPHLELLGIPVAWLPFMSFPDPSEPRISRFTMPSFGYNEKTGAFLSVPYYMAIDYDTDLLITPTLFSRQGQLLGAELTRRFTGGEMTISASGIKQMNPGDFQHNGVKEVGDRDWRGAIQTTGHFTPIDKWTVGWSYTAFTDQNYLRNYGMTTADDSVNEVYATHLSKDHYADIRVQKFNLLSDEATTPPEVAENRQALLIPNARYDGVLTLDDGLSQVGLTARLIGLSRADNDLASAGGVPYVYGYTEDKVHGMVLADWQRQWIGPGGLVTTPYLGIRADATNVNTSNAPGGIYPDPPEDQSLFSVTPIAAVDVRWPLLAIAGEDTQVIEPIAQLVYRGSNVTTPGITNDDAQSFVFDDTNLFSYDRFSGIDRQETGLRANVGVRYQANFADGSWLEMLAGESFHLAGTNSLGVADATQVGAYSGLEDTASYIVLGAKGSFWNTLDAAAKMQIDPNDGKVVRAGFTSGLRWDNYTLALNYIYLAANPALGVDDDQHEIGTVASAPLPFFDYWRVTGGVYWDLAAQQWLKVQGGIDYDDGYLAYGASISKTGTTASTPDDLRMLFKFRLKGPDGANFALSQGF